MKIVNTTEQTILVRTPYGVKRFYPNCRLTFRATVVREPVADVIVDLQPGILLRVLYDDYGNETGTELATEFEVGEDELYIVTPEVLFMFVRMLEKPHPLLGRLLVPDVRHPNTYTNVTGEVVHGALFRK